MNNENLIPFSERTESERREIASKGGKASGEKRRKQKSMKELGELMMSLPVTEETKQLVNSMGEVKVEDSTAMAALIAACYNLGLQGNAAVLKILIEDILLAGAKGADLAERKRHNRAEEKNKKRELDIREKELEQRQSQPTENIDSEVVSNLLSLAAKGKTRGLGEND